MKIALICTEKLPVPPISGGAVQLYIDGIAPYLAQKHDITIFSIQYPGLPDYETVNGIKFVRLPGGDAENYLNSLKKALDSSFDLIHVFNRPRNVIELMKVLPKSRFSLSLHNEMFHPDKISDEESLKCINKVKFINTVSKYIADTVRNRFPQAADKLRVVYSGADTAVFKPAWTAEGRNDRIALRSRYKLQNHKVILYVGRFSPKKGVHVLLEAAKKVMLKAPNTALVVVGSKWYGANESDDYTKELRAKAGQLPGPVIFTGFLPPDQVCRHYSMADAFVCASQWSEPLARVHYEAMAAGLPIITTNRGGNAEVVRDLGNGIVIDDYSNPDKMAESILYLLSNPSKCLEMGRKGRELAERFFNWKRVADEILPESFGLQTDTVKLDKPVSSPISGTAQTESSSYIESLKATEGTIPSAVEEDGSIKSFFFENFNTAGEITTSAGNIEAAGEISSSVGSIEADTQAKNPDEDSNAAADSMAGPQTAESSTYTAEPPTAPIPDRSRFGWKRNVRLLPDYKRR